MIHIARLFSAILLITIIIGLIGNFLLPNPWDGVKLIPIAVPLAYCSWLVWKALKPVKIGLLKFCLAHVAPGCLALLGLIFLFAPNKIALFMLSGVGLICVAGVIIHQMHSQRRPLKVNHRNDDIERSSGI